MKVTPNIGTINALIRITCGLAMLSWCTAKFVRKPRCQSYIFVAICSAMKVAEGIVRYCPVTDLLKNGQNQTHQNQKTPNEMEHNKTDQKPTPQSNNISSQINVTDEIKKFQKEIE